MKNFVKNVVDVILCCIFAPTNTKVRKNMISKISVRETMRQMKRGEELVISYEIAKENTVRFYASMFQGQEGKRYKVARDKVGKRTVVSCV